MKKRYSLIVAASILAAGCSNRLFREAESHYSNYEYAVAARQYETYLATDSSATAMLHLADCYRHMNRHADAQRWYAKAVSSPAAKPEDKLHYAQELKSSGKYTEAQKWYDAYLAAVPNDQAAQNQRWSCDSVQPFSPWYEVQPVDLPVHSSSFSPTIHDGKLYYASEAPLKNGVPANNWTGNGFLDIYSVDPAYPSEATPMDSTINSALHESNIVFAPGGKTVYFTRSAVVETISKRKKKTRNTAVGADRTNRLEICSAELVDGKWTNVRVLPFNNPDFSCGHPALTSGGSRMYFISDRPGGYGGTDLYYSDFVNGNWIAPVNVGSSVNTNGNEMFPTVHVINAGKEELLFSSDGLAGAGGLDIFKANLVEGLPYTIERLPAPFNSPGDDFGLVYADDSRSGYFASNRGAENGDDRIYSFRRKDALFFVNLVVEDKETQTPVINKEVEITNTRTNLSWKLNTDATGHLIFPADSVTTYGFVLHCTDYFCGFSSTTTNGFRGKFNDTTYATIALEKIVINKPIRLENIYYDYNKWNIRPDAAVELDKLVKIMQDNPQIRIELSSHTDSRGSDKYNMTLSQKRAQAAVDYIVSKGISKDRIYAKGYGESKPLNKCVNGVKCTEEEYQWNRRTEFKVVEILK